MFAGYTKSCDLSCRSVQLTVLLLLCLVIFIDSPTVSKPNLEIPHCPSSNSNFNYFGNHFKYFLIGAQKAGTSTLSKFLRSHQYADATRNFPKEFHLFDDLISDEEKDTEHGHFQTVERSFISSHEPSLSPEIMSKNLTGMLLGDATPRYFLSEKIARTVYNLHPSAKILVSLRNPSSRAISHLRMLAERRSLELNSEVIQLFDNALEIEMNSAVKCSWNAAQGILYSSSNSSFSTFLICVRQKSCSTLPAMYKENSKLKRFSEKICREWIVSRGLYLNQLNGWLEYYPKESFMIFDFSDILCRMPTVLGRLEKHLCLPRFRQETYEKARMLSCETAVSQHERIEGHGRPSERVMKKLDDFYHKHNKRLQNVVRQHFPGTSDLNWI